MKTKIGAHKLCALIVTVFRDSDGSNYNNCRGMAFISSARNILARVVFNCLLPVTKAILPESQSGL